MKHLFVAVLCGAVLACTSGITSAATLGADFVADYTAATLGSVPGLPARYGGLTFLDSNTILIGGAANGGTGRIYQVDVIRGADNHITGFTGTATVWPSAGATIGAFNDGGVTFGPGGVLFTSRWPVNELGQTKPGSTAEDKIIDLTALGVAGSHAAVNFVPTGFGGAGRIKLLSWAGGQWYDATLVPDGTGTFDLAGVTQVDLDTSTGGIDNVPGGPEGFTYIAAGNPGFSVNSLLIAEYSANVVAAYEADANGDPLVATRRLFLSDISGAEGAAIDPITGDFLFSTFGGGDQVFLVQGFLVPEVPDPGPSAPVPAPGALILLGTGLIGWAVARRRR